MRTDASALAQPPRGGAARPSAVGLPACHPPLSRVYVPAMPHAVLSIPTSLVLAGIAGLHALWGAGGAWPAGDRRQLADAVAGSEEVPSAAACFAVTGVLLAAATLVAGAGGQRPLARLARAGIAAGLLVRGTAGVTGATALLVPWSPSPSFQALDRRWYGPLCLALGSSIALAMAADVRADPLLGAPAG